MIRTLHFSDFLKLGRLQEAEVGLNLPESLVVPNSPLPAVLLQKLPVQSLGSSVYIYVENGRAAAFAQAATRKHHDEWNVLALGIIDATNRSKDEGSKNAENADPKSEPEATVEVVEMLAQAVPVNSGELELAASEEDEADLDALEDLLAEDSVEDALEDQAEEVARLARAQLPGEAELAWLKLLEHLVVDAGEKGIIRVYAKLSTESSEMSLFSQTGFHSYTHENLFVLHYGSPAERPAGQPAGLKIRSQRNRDAWAISQLYSAITPSPVKNAEQMLSRDWEIHKGYLPRPVRDYGWVVEEDERIIAYVRLMSNRNRHWMTIMNMDSHRSLLTDLVQFALSTLKAGPNSLVYCTVREYQAEQELVLEEAGFTYSGKQAVMVKHTVQYLRNVERATVHLRDRKLELAHNARPNFLSHLWAKRPFR